MVNSLRPTLHHASYHPGANMSKIFSNFLKKSTLLFFKIIARTKSGDHGISTVLSTSKPAATSAQHSLHFQHNNQKLNHKYVIQCSPVISHLNHVAKSTMHNITFSVFITIGWHVIQLASQYALVINNRVGNYGQCSNIVDQGFSLEIVARQGEMI